MADNLAFSNDPSRNLSEFVHSRKYSKVVYLTDGNTKKYCLPKLESVLGPVCTLPSGEEHKNLVSCELIWRFMTDQQLDRHALVVIVGGGVLGDMGGFCASTYKRGIDFVLIPTTLLAQVDSSIGGKLGIDFEHLKNHLGVFNHPALTIISPVFLDTLPETEKRSGFAEIIKHNLIAPDNHWDTLFTTPFSKIDLPALIRHSIEFKASVVSDDPTEKGKRKILNAGHTVGHALETHLLNTNRKISHGDAVAAGIVIEAFISFRKGMLSLKACRDIQGYIAGIFPKVVIGADDYEPITSLMSQDKKNREGKILGVLLENIGDAKWDCEITIEEVKEGLNFYLEN